MSGVELIIFGVGPAAGLVISFMAWLHEGYHTANSAPQPQYHHDSL